MNVRPFSANFNQNMKISKSLFVVLKPSRTAVTLIPTINDQGMDQWTFILCTFKYLLNEFATTTEYNA